VVVSDFGIATTAHRLNTLVLDVTQQDVRGTPQYMAPEQFRGSARIPSDVYALGIIAHELFTGVVPFYFDRSQFDNDFAYMMAFYTMPSRLLCNDEL
jgi:serine/threonine protein kinase